MAKTKASKRKTTKRPARAATKKKAKKAQPRKKTAPKRPRATAKVRRKASPQKARRKAAPKRPVRAKAKPKVKASAPRRKAAAAPKRPQTSAKAGPKPKTPVLQRERRRLPDAERLNANRDMTDDHMMAAVRTGQRGLKADLKKHTETSPALTAGDVDANWEDAYAVGDEAPGGDNPTPDQDRVDDIGKALGVTYQDNEELQGGDEITERDAKRWELDPASSDDWPHKE